MKKKTISLALVLMLAGISFLSAQNAQELRLGGAPVSGSLRSGAEIWYSVRAVADGFIVVETTGETDTYLEAYDNQRNLLKENDDGGEGTNARIDLFAAAGRTYLFKLRGYSGEVSGAYRIWASAEPIPAATELRFGTERQDNLSVGSRKWYSVRTTTGGYVVAETSGDDVDTYMEMYDSRYNLLMEDDDGGSGLNARIEFMAEPNQTYFFAVRSYSNDQSGPYRMFASHEPIPADTERNTDRARAVTVKLGEAIPVYFRAQNESRWYRYEATRQGTIFVVQTRGSMYTRLALYDSRGNLITEDEYSGDYPNALIHQRLNPGTYFIQVSTYSNGVGPTGRCTLHAETR